MGELGQGLKGHSRIATDHTESQVVLGNGKESFHFSDMNCSMRRSHDKEKRRDVSDISENTQATRVPWAPAFENTDIS